MTKDAYELLYRSLMLKARAASGCDAAMQPNRLPRIPAQPQWDNIALSGDLPRIELVNAGGKLPAFVQTLDQSCGIGLISLEKIDGLHDGKGSARDPRA